MFVISQKANRVMKKILFYGLYVLSLWPICDKIFGMKMEYKTFAIIGIMWAFCAHCSVGDSKLTHQKFPKTVNDLSFIEMMQLKAEGYKPWFDKKAYVPIVLKKDGGAQQPAGPMDYCPKSVNYTWAEPAGRGVLADVGHSVVAGQGGVVCKRDEEVNGYYCAQFCTLSKRYKEVESDVCVYSNMNGAIYGSLGYADGVHAFDKETEGKKIVVRFDGIDLDGGVSTDSDASFNKGVKLGRVKDKANFRYCIRLFSSDENILYCSDGVTEWEEGGDCPGSSNGNADEEGETTDS